MINNFTVKLLGCQAINNIHCCNRYPSKY